MTNDVFMDAGEHRLIIRAGPPRKVTYSGPGLSLGVGMEQTPGGRDAAIRLRRDMAMADATRRASDLRARLEAVEEWLFLAKAGEWV